MTTFNPHAPDTLGIEWHPDAEASEPVNAPVRGVGQRVTSTAAEDVGAVAFFLPEVDVASLDDGWEVEVYERDSPGETSTEMFTFLPGAQPIGNGTWVYNEAIHPTIGLYADGWVGLNNYPDELYPGKGNWPYTSAPVWNDRYVYNIYGLGIIGGFKFDDLAGMVGTRRITRVSVGIRFAEMVDWAYVVQNVPATLTPFLMAGGQRYDGPTVTTDKAAPVTTKVDWLANPLTGCSWKAEDVERFDSLDADAGWCLGFAVQPTNTPASVAVIYQMWLEVEVTSDLTDPRVAVGCMRPGAVTAPSTNLQPGWVTVAVASPVSGDPWAKADATDYDVLLRRRGGVGKVMARYLSSSVDELIGASGFTPTFTSGGTYAGHADEESLMRAYPLILLLDGGGLSADSQPYASASGDYEPDVGVNDKWTTVDADTILRQEITTVGADTYGWVRFLARIPTRDTTEPLTVTLESTGGVQQGATLTVNVSDLEEPTTRWQVVEGALGGVPLTATTQYRVKFTTTGAVGEGWEVQVLSTLRGAAVNLPTGAEGETYGGTTDTATVNGAGVDSIDAVVSIATQPAAPAGLAAAVSVQDECWSAVQVSWTATALGDDFLRYELQRLAPSGRWQDLALLSSESDVTVVDRGARPGVEESYRVRVRRTDWSASAWSGTVTGTAAMSCCGYVLTSEFAPELTVYADDLGVERETELLDADDVAYLKLHNRPMQLQYYPLEWRGRRFTRELALAVDRALDGLAAATQRGDATFDDLLNLLPSKGAALPYVLVISSNGDRWYCGVVVKSTKVTEPEGLHAATVEFTEVTDVPEPIREGS